MQTFTRCQFTLIAASSLLTCVAGCHPPAGRDISKPSTAQTLPAADRARDYEQHVRNLADGTPPAAFSAALATLEAAGVDAFPTLIAHFDDDAPAADSLQQATSNRTTVGEACFGLLRRQVEGAWPKGWREFHVLTPENARDWLDARRGLTLDELRVAANRESRGRAEAALAADPSDKSLQRCVEFLKEREAKFARRGG